MVVLVTGATDGLGRGVALARGRRGDTVLVHGRDPSRIEDTMAEVRAPGAAISHRSAASHWFLLPS